MSEATTADRPDLSALSRDVRVRFAVAEAEGAKWDFGRWSGDEQMWVLKFAGTSFYDVVAYGYANGAVDYEHVGALPDYLSDPAAWGALMRSERIDIEHYDGGVLAAAASDEKHPSREFDGWTGDQAEIGPAICQAVLHKYGIDWETLEPERW